MAVDVRSSMVALIEIVKDEIDVEDLEDEDIQRFLDRRRFYFDGQNEISKLSSEYPWNIHVAKYPYCESTATVQNINGTTVTVDSAQYFIDGVFHFSSAQNEQLYIEGNFYDVPMAELDIFQKLTGRAASFSRGAVRVDYKNAVQEFKSRSIFAGESGIFTRGIYSEVE